jgi:hypothetical protein
MTLFIPELPRRLEDLGVAAFQRGACDPQTAELLERLFHALRQSQPWLEWTDADGQPQRGTEAVGYSHRMVELTFRGLTRRKFSNLDWEVALPESEIDAALLYVKAKLQEHQLYNPAIGVVIRADRAVTDTLLGSAAAGSGVAAGERMYHLEFPIFYPYAFSAEQLAAYQAPYVEMLLHLVQNHRARLHLGKNRSDLFAHPAVRAGNADRRALFQPFVDQMDPRGVFANDFLRQAGFSWPGERQDESSARSAPSR